MLFSVRKVNNFKIISLKFSYLNKFEQQFLLRKFEVQFLERKFKL